MGQVVELPPECKPDLSKIPIEDGKPVDSIHNELQQRLLAVALDRPWPGLTRGRRWRVFANVGYFYRVRPTRGLAPDVMLSLDIEQEDPLLDDPARSYFLWERGKPPEVVIEVVSDRTGEELGTKQIEYAAGQVPYYVVYDPRGYLSDEPLQAFRRDPDRGAYARMDRAWFPGLSLGLTIWVGEFEGVHSTWLRWCDEQGRLIPTTLEFAQAETARAEEERRRAEDERRRAEDERQRADAAQQRADRLAARMRELGINPDEA